MASLFNSRLWLKSVFLVPSYSELQWQCSSSDSGSDCTSGSASLLQRLRLGLWPEVLGAWWEGWHEGVGRTLCQWWWRLLHGHRHEGWRHEGRLHAWEGWHGLWWHALGPGCLVGGCLGAGGQGSAGVRHCRCVSGQVGSAGGQCRCVSGQVCVSEVQVGSAGVFSVQVGVSAGGCT